jgi:hypothetical protein
VDRSLLDQFCDIFGVCAEISPDLDKFGWPGKLEPPLVGR